MLYEVITGPCRRGFELLPGAALATRRQQESDPDQPAEAQDGQRVELL